MARQGQLETTQIATMHSKVLNLSSRLRAREKRLLPEKMKSERSSRRCMRLWEISHDKVQKPMVSMRTRKQTSPKLNKILLRHLKSKLRTKRWTTVNLLFEMTKKKSKWPEHLKLSRTTSPWSTLSVSSLQISGTRWRIRATTGKWGPRPLMKSTSPFKTASRQTRLESCTRQTACLNSSWDFWAIKILKSCWWPFQSSTLWYLCLTT